MRVGSVKWLGVAATLTVVGVAGVLGHVLLARDMGPFPYVVLAVMAIGLGLAIGQAAAEVNRRHEQEIERRNEELSALNAVAVTANRSLQMESVLLDCLDKTLEVMKLDAGAVFVLSPEGQPRLVADRGLTSECLALLAERQVSEEVAGSVVVPEVPLLLEDRAPKARSEPMRATVSVPLRSEGAVLGAMYLVTRGFRAYTEREAQILMSIGSVIGMAVRNSTLHAEVIEHATRDALTGVRNRRHFDEVYQQEVARSRRYGTPLTVAMLDIDSFKQINDRFGHRAGDAVLVAVGEVLRNGRSTDISARYGGDEFVILMPNTDLSGATAVAERIRRAARDIILPGIAERGVELSIGLADSSEGYEDLLDRADTRMYLVKREAHAGG